MKTSLPFVIHEISFGGIIQKVGEKVIIDILDKHFEYICHDGYSILVNPPLFIPIDTEFSISGNVFLNCTIAIIQTYHGGRIERIEPVHDKGIVADLRSKYPKAKE